MNARTKNVLIVVIVAVALGLVVYLVAGITSNASDSATTLSRRSPLSDYQAASAAHIDCRKNIEDRAIGGALTAANTEAPPEVRAAARLAGAMAAADLNEIERWCPTPLPPVFDAAGTLVLEPFIPEQYRATLDRTTNPPG